ncbi:5-hydroxyisourate hydrolase [Robbsia andropogonis]|uniref:5-hydroxyisourate hydrolase n=1 Tax=Robbsia andropogonis TaxID=28092 RepID=A0A0F5JYQ5_9BURK|nr:5-hydroxyisourate hydrolase [Robbsia andropogonis]
MGHCPSCVASRKEQDVNGRLTTHVLDTAAGRPAAGMVIRLTRITAQGGDEMIGTFLTNADGRCAAPLLEGAALTAATYELRFAAGDYFRTVEATRDLSEPRFVDIVILRFGIADPTAHYHVPLLVSPWSYSTYRGS